MAKVITSTHRIEIRVDDSDKETYKENWKKLSDTSNLIAQVYNHAVTGYYMDFVLNNGIKEINLVEETQLSDTKTKLLQNFLGVGRGTKTTVVYTALVDKFPSLPSYIILGVDYEARNKVQQQIKEGIKYGNTSLATYKKGCPIPGVTKNSVVKKQMIEDDKGHIEYTFVWNKIKFITVNSWKDNNNSKYLNMCWNSDDPFKDSKIQIKGKKIYLLLITQEVKEIDNTLDYTKSIGIDLGIKVPLVASTMDGTKSIFIGSVDDFGKVRLSIQNNYKKKQKHIIAKTGEGRRNYNNAMNRFSEKERNFVKTKNHEYSKKVVEFAFRNKAGVIKMENLSFAKENGEEDKNSANAFFLRNWSYFELQTMIEYKAKKYGIDVVYVDSHYTSQMCSKCGHTHKDNRLDQEHFVCTGCGHKMNADKNASINIARSEVIERLGGQSKKAAKKEKKLLEKALDKKE